MKMKLGNLLPDEEATVKVSFVTKLTSEILNFYTIRVPMTYISHRESN
jgi:hypothetical protein